MAIENVVNSRGLFRSKQSGQQELLSGRRRARLLAIRAVIDIHGQYFQVPRSQRGPFPVKPPKLLQRSACFCRPQGKQDAVTQRLAKSVKIASEIGK